VLAAHPAEPAGRQPRPVQRIDVEAQRVLALEPGQQGSERGDQDEEDDQRPADRCGPVGE